MEKTCPNCRVQNSPDAMFCRNCATPLPSAPNQGRTGMPNQPQYQNQQYQNQQWQSPQGQGFQQNMNAAPPAANGNRANIAAILAILGIFCCGPFAGVPAALMGWMEISAIREGRAPADGMTKAQIGLWGGVIGTVLGVLGYIIIFLSSMMNGGY